MPCFHPLTGYRSKQLSPSGKRPIVFNPKHAIDDGQVTLPCGQCVGCRLDRSRQWAIRCSHEAQMHEKNCFITLTYDNDHLPHDGSLRIRDFQNFMKRLRKKYGEGIRFFHCGEYGENFGRPHYHACLFNFDFPDKTVWRMTDLEHIVWRSKSLEELWPFGFSEIGSVTFESAAYVARYIMKKVNGDAAEKHYIWIDPATGEIHPRKPEYVTMSRRPGIGKAWFDKFYSDVYPDDFIVMRGRKMKPPKYYDSQFEILAPHEFDDLKERRALDFSTNQKLVDNSTKVRLHVREQVTQARLKQLKRKLD